MPSMNAHFLMCRPEYFGVDLRHQSMDGPVKLGAGQ